MKKHFKEDEWNIVGEVLHPEMQESSESVFSIGIGRVGQRANFEFLFGEINFQDITDGFSVEPFRYHVFYK